MQETDSDQEGEILIFITSIVPLEIYKQISRQKDLSINCPAYQQY